MKEISSESLVFSHTGVILKDGIGKAIDDICAVGTQHLFLFHIFLRPKTGRILVDVSTET